MAGAGTLTAVSPAAAGDTHPRLRAAAVQAASPFLDRAAGVIRGHPLWLHFWSSNDRRSVAAYERLFANALTVPADEVRTLCDAAAACDANVVVGITEKRPGTTGTLYNSQLFIGRDGTLLGKRQKIVHAPVAARVWRWSERQRLASRGRPVRLLTSTRRVSGSARAHLLNARC